MNSACRVVVVGLEYTANLSVHHQRPFSFSTDLVLTQFKILDTAPFPDTNPGIRTGNTPPVNAVDMVSLFGSEAEAQKETFTVRGVFYSPVVSIQDYSSDETPF